MISSYCDTTIQPDFPKSPQKIFSYKSHDYQADMGFDEDTYLNKTKLEVQTANHYSLSSKFNTLLNLTEQTKTQTIKENDSIHHKHTSSSQKSSLTHYTQQEEDQVIISRRTTESATLTESHEAATQTQISSPYMSESQPPSVTSRLDQRSHSLLSRLEIYLSSIQNAEPKLSIIRAISIFILISLSSLAILLKSANQEVPIDQLAIITYFYLAVRLLIDIVGIKYLQRTPLKKSDDIFDIVETVCYIILITSIKHPDTLSIVLMSLLYIMATVTHCFFGKISKNGKIYRNSTRALYIIQGGMILLKVTRILEDRWQIAFLPFWMYSLTEVMKITSRSILLVMKIYDSIVTWRVHRYVDRECSRGIAAKVWYLAYESLWSVIFIFLLGLYKQLNNDGYSDLIRTSAIIGLSGSFFMLIYTFLISEIMIDYIELYDLLNFTDDDSNNEEEVGLEQSNQKQGTLFTLQSIKSTRFFVRCSSTYYTPIKLDLSPKNLQTLKEEELRAYLTKLTKDSREDAKGISFDGERLCYICYSRPSDAILVSCGHGGVCYDCMSMHVKKEGNCMECRAKVEGIAQIDPEPESEVENIYRSNRYDQVQILENRSII